MHGLAVSRDHDFRRDGCVAMFDIFVQCLRWLRLQPSVVVATSTAQAYNES